MAIKKGTFKNKSGDSLYPHTSADCVEGLSAVATSNSYNDLNNKPTIPTVNNATLTIQKNGTQVATFTANASSNVTANITVPTKTSDITNDSGFVTSTGAVSRLLPVCYVGSDQANTNGWYKIATSTLSGYGNQNILYFIKGGYSNGYSGILNLEMRSDNSSIRCWKCVWLTRLPTMKEDLIKIVISGMTWTMYAYNYSSQYGRLYFTEISNRSINGGNPTWSITYFNSTTPESTEPIATETSSDYSIVLRAKQDVDGNAINTTYLKTSAKAADADKLDGNDSTYYLNYNNLTNKPTIPTNNNQLTNGAGYTTNTGTVIGSNLTANKIVVGNGTVNVKVSDYSVSDIVSIAEGKTATYVCTITGTNAVATFNSQDDTVTINAATFKAKNGTNINTDDLNIGDVILITDQDVPDRWVSQKPYSGVAVFSKLETLKITVPTKVSELTNDSGFTTNTGTVTSVRVQAGTGLSSSTSTAQSTSLNTTISIASGYKLPTTTEWNAIPQGTVTSVKVGTTSYNPSGGVVSLPAYPTTLPASDVSSWAKASSKPSYTLDEVTDGTNRKLLTIGSTATTAAAGNHTHTTSLATDTGTSAITLSYGGKYKLTAGGSSVIFTMPSADDTNTWRPVSGNGTSIGSNSLNIKPGSNVSVSVSNGDITISATDTNTHNTHKVNSGYKSDGSTAITSSSASSGDITLGDSGVTAGSYGDSSNQTPAYGATFKVPYITVNAKGIVTGVSEHTVKIPASDNSNSWRKVQLNGTDKLGTGTNTNPLNLKAGTNVTITESSGTFTFAATDTTYESKTAASGGTAVSLVTTGEKYTWNNKQNALTSQTAYSAKGSATKVPQITTNSLGQVTGITEVTITQPTASSLNAVQYTSQSLTSAQMALARNNIGAGTSNFSGSYNDLTNKPTKYRHCINMSFYQGQISFDITDENGAPYTNYYIILSYFSNAMIMWSSYDDYGTFTVASGVINSSSGRTAHGIAADMDGPNLVMITPTLSSSTIDSNSVYIVDRVIEI